MADPHRPTVSDFYEAQEFFKRGIWLDSDGLDSNLDVLLSVTRNLTLKDKVICDPSTFEALIKLYDQASEPECSVGHTTRINLLRVIGNYVADNDDFRLAVSRSPRTWVSLGNGLRLKVNEPESLEIADTVVKVLYNVMNDDHDPVIAEASKQDLDRTLLQYIHQRPWTDKEEILELAVSLFTSMTVASTRTQGLEKDDLGSDFVHQLLNLPCIEQVDGITFVESIEALRVHVARPSFQLDILQHGQIAAMFKILDKAAFLKSTLTVEENAEVEKILLTSFTDVSTHESFPAAIALDDPVIDTLCSRCVLSESHPDQATAAVCACLAVGNLAVNEAAAISLAKKIDMNSLFNFICLRAYGRSRDSGHGSGDTDYLYAAAGLLRNLSLPRSNQQMYFISTEAQHAAMALIQYSEPRVQLQGLRLYRQILQADFEPFRHMIDVSLHVTILRTFQEKDFAPLKLEIARTVTVWLRILHDNRTSKTAEASIQKLLSEAKEMAEPLAFAAKQSHDVSAHTDAWLGLCLLAGVAGNPDIVASLFTDKALFTALESELSGQQTGPAPTAATASDTRSLMPAGADVAQSSDSDPSRVYREKAAENALLLVHDLLQSQKIDPVVRERLESMARTAGLLSEQAVSETVERE